MPFRWRRALVTVALFALPVAANWNDTPTGLDLKKLRHFPLTKLHSGRLKAGASFSFDGITAVDQGPSQRAVTLRASGKAGKRWSANLSALDEVWRGDLDGNGAQDYVFFETGPYGNGRMAPSFSLSFLLMDADGLPTPIFTTVYLGENGDGIRHVVDLDDDQRAELLISDYDENASDPRAEASCSGHWVHQLYRFRNFGLEEAKGIHGGINFPLIHNWSQRLQCGEIRRPRPTEPATISDYQTLTGGLRTVVRQVDANLYLKIAPVGGCKTVARTVTVFDGPKLREIAFPNQFDDEFAARLINKMMRNGSPVDLRGVTKLRSSGDCAVALLWATQR